eukprot:g2311.t1
MEEVDEEIIWELWNDGPGGAYYFNTLTGESQWHEPECNPNQIASKLHLCETDYDWEESGETRPPPPAMKRGIAKLTALRLFKRELTPLSSAVARVHDALYKHYLEQGQDFFAQFADIKVNNTLPWLRFLSTAKHFLHISRDDVTALKYLFDVRSEEKDSVNFNHFMDFVLSGETLNSWTQVAKANRHINERSNDIDERKDDEIDVDPEDLIDDFFNFRDEEIVGGEWEKWLDGDRVPFYHNVITGVTQWEKPPVDDALIVSVLSRPSSSESFRPLPPAGPRPNVDSSAALKIQCLTRKYAAQKKFKQKRAALSIQKFARMIIAFRLVQMKRENLAILRIQSWWRHTIRAQSARRRVRLLREELAAIHIQTFGRYIIAVASVNGKRENLAALKIQCLWQSEKAKKRVDELRQAKKEFNASILLQSCWRSIDARRKFAKMQQSRAEQNAALILQNGWRMADARSRVSQLRDERDQKEAEMAALIIQNGYRCREARDRLHDRRQFIKRKRNERGAITMQCAYRSYTSKIKLAMLRDARIEIARRRKERDDQEASLLMQKGWRVYEARREVERRKKKRDEHQASLLMQKGWRAREARLEVARRRQERDEKKAIILLQSGWRCRESRIEVERRRKEYDERQASLLIQGMWRSREAHVEVSHRRQERDEERAIISVQSSWRCRESRIKVARRRQYRNDQNANREDAEREARGFLAARSVQSLFRGFQVRSQLAERELDNAASCIQRVFRKWLVQSDTEIQELRRLALLRKISYGSEVNINQKRHNSRNLYGRFTPFGTFIPSQEIGGFDSLSLANQRQAWRREYMSEEGKFQERRVTTSIQNIRKKMPFRKFPFRSTRSIYKNHDWKEIVHANLLRSGRAWRVEKDIDLVIKIIYPLHRMMEAGADSRNQEQSEFLEKYGAQLEEAKNYMDSYLDSKKGYLLNEALIRYDRIFRSIDKEISLEKQTNLNFNESERPGSGLWDEVREGRRSIERKAHENQNLEFIDQLLRESAQTDDESVKADEDKYEEMRIKIEAKIEMLQRKRKALRGWENQRKRRKLTVEIHNLEDDLSHLDDEEAAIAEKKKFGPVQRRIIKQIDRNPVLIIKLGSKEKLGDSVLRFNVNYTNNDICTTVVSSFSFDVQQVLAVHNVEVAFLTFPQFCTNVSKQQERRTLSHWSLKQSVQRMHMEEEILMSILKERGSKDVQKKQLKRKTTFVFIGGKFIGDAHETLNLHRIGKLIPLLQKHKVQFDRPNQNVFGLSNIMHAAHAAVHSALFAADMADNAEEFADEAERIRDCWETESDLEERSLNQLIGERPLTSRSNASNTSSTREARAKSRRERAKSRRERAKSRRNHYHIEYDNLKETFQDFPTDSNGEDQLHRLSTHSLSPSRVVRALSRRSITLNMLKIAKEKAIEKQKKHEFLQARLSLNREQENETVNIVRSPNHIGYRIRRSRTAIRRAKTSSNISSRAISSRRHSSGPVQNEIEI